MIQSWEPLQGTSSLFSHLGNKTADGSATLADSQLVTTIDEEHVVEFIIDNLDDGDHPFHLHGHKVRVIYGVLLEDLGGFGSVAARAAFVIDKAGVIQYAEQTPTPHDLPHFEAIKARLAEL